MNTTDQEKVYYLSTLNFSAADEAGAPEFINPASGLTDLANWINFPEKEIIVPAEGTVSVVLTISVPKDVTAGTYHAAIVASDYPTSESENVIVVSQVASLVFLEVEGDYTRNAAILDFKTDQWTNSMPVSFSFRIQNQGDVYLKPTGLINVTSLFGKVVGHLSVNNDGGRILPRSTREYQAVWQRAESVGDGFWNELKNEWQNFGLGRYRADLIVDYEGSQPLETSVYFWIIPWHLLLVSLSVVVLMLVISRLKIRINKHV